MLVGNTRRVRPPRTVAATWSVDRTPPDAQKRTISFYRWQAVGKLFPFLSRHIARDERRPSFMLGTAPEAGRRNIAGQPIVSRIHILHENSAWLPPLAQALDQRQLPWTEWFLDAGTFDLAAPPPPGVFYNRMSASSHTRGHRFSAELTAAVLAWLEGHGRRVVNGSRALDLEISKLRQYAALEAASIRTPDTVLVAGKELLS